MAIEVYTGFIVKCDRCKDVTTYDGSGIEIYKSKKEARINAKLHEFTFRREKGKTEKVYCPECSEY